MTERIMYSEKHVEYIKQTRKQTTTDTSNDTMMFIVVVCLSLDLTLRNF